MLGFKQTAINQIVFNIMEPKPYKVEKTYNGKIEYRKIQDWQAKEYDGQLSN